MTTIVSIAQGGTGANNAAAARNTLGAAANTGGIFTGAINVATANITTIVTGNALTLSTGTASNGNIIFSSNGTEDMRITNTGFIGIFTSTPNSNLTVVGNVWATTGVNAATVNASTVNVTSTLGGGSTLTIQPNVTISQSLTVTGNLIVSGSSTTLNTEILIVEDADIVLLSNVTGTPVLNSGITVNRGTSTNTFLRWSEDGDRWGWTDDGTTFYSFDNVRSGLVTTNTTFATINTTTATMNTATSNRVLKAGDTMTGNLIVSGATINTATANITTIITGNVLTLGTGSGSNANIIFSANSAEDMRIDAVTGNIAIGVSNTSQRLYVGVSVTDSTNGSSTAANSYPISRFMAHGSGGGIRGLEIGGPAGGINSPVYIKVADTSVRFSILNNTGTEQLTILNGGDVGIGTTSPGVKLDVIGAIRSSTTTSGNTVSATTDFRLNNATFSRVAIGDGGGGWLGGYSITYSSGAVYSDLGFLSGIYYTNGGTIQFYTGPSANAGTAAPERMRITSGGSVGIGTNNPATRLDVRGYVTSDVNSNSVEGGFYLGNSNHGIRRPAAVNDVYVYTSGGSLYLGGGGSSSQNVAITTGGDFLIGTTSSLGRITSTGSGNQSIYFTHSDNSPGRTVTLRLGTNSSTYATYSAYVQAIQGVGIDNYSLAFGTSAGAAAVERMRIANGGNVGINSSSPGYTLDVNGTFRSTGTAALGTSVAQGDPSSTDITANAYLLLNGVGGNYLSFGQKASNLCQWIQSGYQNPTTAVYPISLNPLGGNVGIGTLSPSNKLDVIGNALIQGNQGFNATDETASLYIGDTASEIRAVYDRGLDFYQNGTHRMRIQGSTGNVGIGTTSPGAKLDVNGQIYISGVRSLARINSIDTGYNYHVVGVAGGGSSGSGALGAYDIRTPNPQNFSTGMMSFGFTSYNLDNTANWADYIFMNSYTDSSGGDPNIFLINRGTSGVKVARQSYNSATAFNAGTIYTLNFTSASDASVKEDVQNITDALDKIMQLRPVTFKWTDEYIQNGMSRNSNEHTVDSETGAVIIPEEKTVNVGLIAQEVEAIIPTVVHQENVKLKGAENYLKNVNYDKLVPHLIAALQEVKAELDAAKLRITELEKI